MGHTEGLRFSKENAFSLIEVLVALLVLGVGVIGFAALELKSVKRAEESYSRSQAMAIAQDLMERVRANGADSALDHYLEAETWTEDLNDPGDCVVVNETPSIDDACSPEDMAEFDAYQVRSNLSNLLVNGTIQFTECGAIYCVAVAWADTPVDDCDQAAFEDGNRQSSAHCVQVEFIP